SSPVVMPTTSITMLTSMATARMLMIVRTGRCRTLATIILVTTRRLAFRAFLGVTLFAQLDQLRTRRLSQLELLRRYGLIELRAVQDRYGQAVILDRPLDLDAHGVAQPLKVPVTGILYLLDQTALRSVELESRDVQRGTVERNLSLQRQLRRLHSSALARGLKDVDHVIPGPAPVFFLPVVGLAGGVDRRNQQRLEDVLRPQALERVLGGPVKRRFAFDEFLLRRNIEPEFAAVRDHIKDVGPDYGGFADHADHRRFLDQDEGLHIAVLLHDA